MNPYLNSLQLKYQPLLGLTFQATYRGPSLVPETGNLLKDVLSIRKWKGDPISDTLSSSFDEMQTAYGDSIWKGITYGVDEHGNPVHLLWVEPGFGGKISQQSIRNFRIDHCTALQGDGSPFSAVVNINASVII